MTRHYGPSERKRMGDLSHGMRVSTGTIANATYLADTQQEIFTVVGRILVLQLYCEAITVFDAVASTFLFNATFSVPPVVVQPMCAAAGVNALPQGNRVVFVGGAVATAAVTTGLEGISDVTCVNPHIIGTATIAGVMGAGTIGILTAGGPQTTGTCQISIYYAPMEDGSYVSTTL